MNKFGVRYTPECARLISKLSPEVKRLVRSAIDSLRAKPTTGTELTGELAGYRSQRVRRYRIIYRINETEFCIDSAEKPYVHPSRASGRTGRGLIP